MASASFSRYGMDRFLRTEVLHHDSIDRSLAHLIGSKFNANAESPAQSAFAGGSVVDYTAILSDAMQEDPSLADATVADLQRFQLVDQACDGLLGVYLFYKGLQTISTARIASYYWREAGGHGKQIARLLQSEMADVFGVDIHPGARMHARARAHPRPHALGKLVMYLARIVS